MRGLFDRLVPQDTFGNSFLPSESDLAIGKAMLILRFLTLAEKGGEISKEQADRLGGLVYTALQRGGVNLPLLTQVSPRQKDWSLSQTVFAPEAPGPEESIDFAPEAPGPEESIEAPILPIEAPVDPIYEWINAQGGLDNVLKAIQKNGWADTSSWEKDGRKFTVADIKRLGKT